MAIIDRGKFEKLIKFLDYKIKLYSSKFLLFKSNIDATHKIDSNLLCERTLSTFANKCIEEFFSDYTNTKIFISEFNIKKNNVSNYDILLKKLEVSLPFGGKSKKYNNCYIDGFISFNNLYNINYNYVFVEYKLNKKFIYNELALDFLKYKLLMKDNYQNTIFVYIIFDKRENYPSILDKSSGLPEFCLINDVITKGTILDDKQIYVYIPRDDASSLNLPSVDNIQPATDQLLKIKQEDEKIIYLKENPEEIATLSKVDREIIKQTKHFNTKVFLSKLIKDNYSELETLWNKIINQNEIKKENLEFFKEFESGDQEKKEFLLPKLIEKIKSSGDYFKNRIDYFYKNEKAAVQKVGLNAYYKKSLHFLVNISVLSDMLLGEKAAFKYYQHKRAKRNEQFIDDNEVAESLFKQYKEVYIKEGYREEYISAVLTSLFYLHYSYPKIFKIENNVIKEEIEYEDVDSHSLSLFKYIKELNKTLTHKNKKWPSTIDNLKTQDILEYVTDFITLLEKGK